MSNFTQRLGQMRRPRLLTQAAQHALPSYRRGVQLRTILAATELPCTARALEQLIDIEDAQNRARMSADAAYSVVFHVHVLTAIMAELHALQAPAYAGAAELT